MFAVGGNGVAYDGLNINSGDYYWFSGGPSTFVSFLTMGGGTLVICGNLTITNINFNSGTIIITAGGSLTFINSFNMNSNSTIVNYGTLNIQGNCTMNGSPTRLFNASSTSVINMNNTTNQLSVNGDSQFVNYGVANIYFLVIQANTMPSVCLMMSSNLNLTNLTNNQLNSVSAPSGPACLSYTGNADLNQNLSNTSNLMVCQATGATTSGGGNFGSATVVPNCNSCSVALPITLLSFDATCQAEKVKLNWATATEINNDFFTIERTTDGVNWQIIGMVNGAGNSNTVRYYTYIDEKPAEGINYYRLKQTDFNGQFEYFNIVAISCKNNVEEITIYPNPNTGTFIIKGAEINSDVIVTDVLGQVIYKTKITAEKTEINLRQQPKGVYFVQVNTPSRWMSKKIIIN